MPRVTKEQIEKAKEWDLFSYLQNYEPHELKRCGPNEYCTRTHDSLKISNGKWKWWSRGNGGRSAVDYLINVRRHTFTEAVQTIAGQATIAPPVSLPAEKTTEKKENIFLSLFPGPANPADVSLVIVYSIALGAMPAV